MSGRISYPGIEHGDRVRLTGKHWPGKLRDRVFTVDDETYHRPVIIEPDGRNFPWYLMDEPNAAFTVTKVAE